MPEGAPPIPAIKPNLEAKALVPVEPVKKLPPQSETQKPPELENQAPPQKKPQETRARWVIRRHEPVTKGNARTILENLASQPAPAKPEATQVSQPERRAETDALLQEASRLLFAIKDARVALTTLARQAADTPLGLGNEFRDQVLAMIQQLDANAFPKDNQLTTAQLDTLNKLKTDMMAIRPLPQPEIKPQETELYRFLKKHPASEQTGALLQALEQGASNPTVVKEALKNPQFQDVAGALKKELFGTSPLPQTAEDVLKAAGLSVDQKNVKQMEGILNPKKKLTAKDIGGGLLMAFMITMMSSQVIGPLLREEGEAR